PWVGDAHAAARLVAASEATGSSAQFLAGIEIRPAPGWHTYWRSPGDAGMAPRVDWHGSQNLARAALAWPAPRRFSVQGFDSAGYDGDVVLPVTVTLARPGRPATLHAALDYAVCAALCVPYHAELALAVPQGSARPGPQAPLIARFAARVPKPAAAAHVVVDGIGVDGGRGLWVRLRSTGAKFVAPDLFVEGAGDASFGRPQVTLAADGRSALFRVPVSDARPADLVGHALVLTLVDGPRAAEIAARPCRVAPPSL
ncbi:MAG TPA: protein-disulfide reductase DsbD domain-containing protein, partial [Stellaceae bacterium]|nr:protein-disulfide reductase DsbD domain-containing protein [Stellaceae bacterium]